MARTIPAALALMLMGALTAQDKPKAPLPCFPDEGPAVFTVEGVSVPKAAVERFKSTLKVRHPKLSEVSLTRKAIEEGIIPQASMYSQHRKRMAELTATAAKVKERLDLGEKFEAVSLDFSDDPGRYNKSVVGAFTRAGIAGASLSIALEEVVFKMKEGTVEGPVVGPVGIQFVKLLKVTPGAEPRQEQREIAHILLHYNADYSKALRSWRPGVEDPELAATLGRVGDATKRAVRKARVKLVDKSYRKFLYPYRIAKEG